MGRQVGRLRPCGGISELQPRFGSKHFPCLLPSHHCINLKILKVARPHFTGEYTEAQGG